MTRLTELAQVLDPDGRDRVADVRMVRGNELHCSVRPAGIGALADLLRDRFGAELLFMAAADRRADRGALRGPLSLRGRLGRTGSSTPPPRVPAEAPTIPSLATFHYPVSRFEREIYDLFGITAEGHPDAAAPRAPRVLARRLLPAAEGRGAARVHRRRAGLPVHRGGRRGRVRDPGGAGPRRRDRAGPLPLQRRGRDDHRHEVASVLHPQGHREALRGPRARRRGRSWPERISGDTHRGPFARLLPGAGGGGRDDGARAGALPSRRAPRDGAPLQPRGRLSA